jgi:hypothetical protein
MSEQNKRISSCACSCVCVFDVCMDVCVCVCVYDGGLYGYPYMSAYACYMECACVVYALHICSDVRLRAALYMRPCLSLLYI